MRVIVCGGREFQDFDLMFYTLDKMHEVDPFRMVTEGASDWNGKDAPAGADFGAYVWAMSRKVPCLRVPADWGPHGKKAGPLRNQKMLEMVKPDRVIGFPGVIGTDSMMELAEKMGVKRTFVTALHPSDMPEGYASMKGRLRRYPNGPITEWRIE